MIDTVLFDWRDTLAHAAPGERESLASTTVALLESLRRRGMRLALVLDGAEPPDLAAFGIGRHFDAVVAGDVVAALRELDADPDASVYVGADLSRARGAAASGVVTVQALWFRADEQTNEQHEDDEPDFMAFTQMDVLNAIERLTRE